MIKVNSNSLNLKGGKTLVGDFEYSGSISQITSQPSIVRTTCIQSDGKIVLGGEFTSYSGSEINYIVRINPDGTKDLDFNIGTGFNIYVNSIIQQSDGKLVVGGQFTQYSGSTTSRIVRINPSGSIDTTFAISGGFNNEISSIIQQSDGKIVAGGGFTSYSGSANNYIVRINPDGTKDTTFNIGTGFDTRIVKVIQQSDGKIVAGGRFNSYSGSESNYIARINPSGSIDTTFAISGGFDYYVSTIIQQLDDKLVVGGEFYTYSGSDNTGIVRINPDGTKDLDFNIGEFGFDGFPTNPLSISQQSDGKLIIGGDFTLYSGSADGKYDGIIPLNTSGSINENFNVGGGVRTPGNIRTVCRLNNNDILVGGQISRLSIPPLTQSFGGLMLLLDNNLNIKQIYPFDATINTIIQQSDEKIVVGGFFTTYSGSITNRIVRINSNGIIDPDFNVGGGFGGPIYSIVQQPDNKLIVGGFFSSYSGSANNNIVRINPSGSIDTTFAISGGFNNTVRTIIQQSDGKIVAGGSFTSYSGSANNRIVRINSNGTKDTTFNIGTGFDNDIFSIIQQSDGKIVAGGNFTLYSGSANNDIVRINPNGTKDTTFVIGTGFNNDVSSIIQQTDNKLVVVGSFFTYSGSSNSCIVRINPSGSIDTTFNIGTGFRGILFNSADSIIQQPNGNLLVGGEYNQYSGSGGFNVVSINNDGTITEKRIN